MEDLQTVQLNQTMCLSTVRMQAVVSSPRRVIFSRIVMYVHAAGEDGWIHASYIIIVD
jgi:hypothetical protein